MLFLPADAVHIGKSFIHVVTVAAEVEFIHLNPYYKHGFPYSGKVRDKTYLCPSSPTARELSL